MGEFDSGWTNYMGSQEFLHLRLRQRIRALAESATWSNYAELEHDDLVAALCVVRGKKSAHL